MITPDLVFPTLQQQNFAYASLATVPLTMPKEEQHVCAPP
jgi:hypothetical protein